MYPRIPWELISDPLGSTEHTLGTTTCFGIRLQSAASGIQSKSVNHYFIATAPNVTGYNVKSVAMIMYFKQGTNQLPGRQATKGHDPEQFPAS